MKPQLENKVLVVGSTGLIGSAVCLNISSWAKVIRASRSRSDNFVDIEEYDSIHALLRKVGPIDHVVSAPGNVPLVLPECLKTTNVEEFITNKFLGQLNLAFACIPHLNSEGSIILTAGNITGHLPGSALGQATNGGLTSFASALATDLPRGIRCNVISPGWVSATSEDGAISATNLAAIYGSTLRDRSLNGEVIYP